MTASKMDLKLSCFLLVVFLICHAASHRFHEEEVNKALLTTILQQYGDNKQHGDQQRNVAQHFSPHVEKDPFFKWIKNLLFKKKKKPKCPVPKPCETSLPVDAREECQAQRKKDIFMARLWYQITDEPKPSKTEFPFKSVPWLNQTLTDIKYYFALDPFESRIVTLLNFWFTAIVKIQSKIQASFPNFQHTYQEYAMIVAAYDSAIEALKAPQYFSSHMDDPTFTNTITDNRWMNDDIFTQQFMAGSCPFVIRKVTEEGETGMKADIVKKQLNNNFNFNVALSTAFNKDITLTEAISYERLFVIYHPEHNGLPSHPDFQNTSDSKTMINSTSPISLFILNEEGELKIAAIQWDYTPDSAVFTPNSDQHDWMMAKGMASVSHTEMCSFYYHAGHVHFAGSIFCFSFRRHFSTKHPLYEVFKFHCEGTTPHITITWASLIVPGSAGDGHSIGYQGLQSLAFKGYNDRLYRQWDYPEMMKMMGLDDDRIKYNPFVKDGKLIWDALKKYAEQIVNEYYHYNWDVKEDTELQSFANELSPDGKIGPEAGLGKFTGFPSSFTSRRELQDFLTSFMWIPVFHTLVNYPLVPQFMPATPCKLYEDAEHEDSYSHSLPNLAGTLVCTLTNNVVGYFRANRILDYHNKLQDRRLQRIAYKTYHKFHGCIHEELYQRNMKRKEAGQLSMSYLMPRWLTTSVHT